MSILLIGITLVVSGYIGWTIGANDAANCVGAGVGSGKMTVKQAVIITCIFSFLGAVLLGSNVIKTVGKGIVPLHELDPNVCALVALSACFGAATWVLIATMRGLPVSTSHSIVGAVAGAGLAIGAPVIWKKVLDIFICWIATPFGAALISFVLYKPFRLLFYRIIPKRFTNAGYIFFVFLTSSYLAFIWGSNDVANATGLITGIGIMDSKQAAMFGSVAIIIGIATMGRKVIQTVGFGITRLAPIMAIVAEIASGLNVQIYTLLGIPVSTSHSIVGAVMGVGLIKGVRVINGKIIKEIILAWSLTPLASGFISFLTIKIILFLVK